MGATRWEAGRALAATLERKHPRHQADVALTPWQRLERLVAEEGFVGEEAVAALLGCPPDEAARAVRRWGGAALTPWQRLERLVTEEGFVGEETVAALLGCPPDEAARAVRRWGGPALHVLPGLGVCAPEALGEIRQLIEDGELAQRAA